MSLACAHTRLGILWRAPMCCPRKWSTAGGGPTQIHATPGSFAHAPSKGYLSGLSRRRPDSTQNAHAHAIPPTSCSRFLSLCARLPGSFRMDAIAPLDEHRSPHSRISLRDPVALAHFTSSYFISHRGGSPSSLHRTAHRAHIRVLRMPQKTKATRRLPLARRRETRMPKTLFRGMTGSEDLMRLAAQGPSASRAAAAGSWDPKYDNLVFPDGNATLDTRSAAPQSRSSRALDLSLHFSPSLQVPDGSGAPRGGAERRSTIITSGRARSHSIALADHTSITTPQATHCSAPASAPGVLRRRRARPRPLYANRELRAQTQAPTAAAEALRHDENDDINALPHRRRSCHTRLLFLLFAFCPLPAYFCQPRSSHRQKLRHHIALRCAETGRGRKSRIASVVIGLAGAGGFLPLSVLDLCASYLRGAVTRIFTCSAFSVFCLRPVHPGRAYDAASRAKFAHLEIASPTPAAVHDSKTLARFCSSFSARHISSFLLPASANSTKSTSSANMSTSTARLPVDLGDSVMPTAFYAFIHTNLCALPNVYPSLPIQPPDVSIGRGGICTRPSWDRHAPLHVQRLRKVSLHAVMGDLHAVTARCCHATSYRLDRTPVRWCWWLRRLSLVLSSMGLDPGREPSALMSRLSFDIVGYDGVHSSIRDMVLPASRPLTRLALEQVISERSILESCRSAWEELASVLPAGGGGGSGGSGMLLRISGEDEEAEVSMTDGEEDSDETSLFPESERRVTPRSGLAGGIMNVNSSPVPEPARLATAACDGCSGAASFRNSAQRLTSIVAVARPSSNVKQCPSSSSAHRESYSPYAVLWDASANAICKAVYTPKDTIEIEIEGYPISVYWQWRRSAMQMHISQRARMHT
ncbi:hypothetical protein BDW22DRAFT_1419845 [Trametopsis cervina]|nr:hypothetical protein BDW22DRAFT_1419845 [Trametopsis cervina]